jgi:hypothetical protein
VAKFTATVPLNIKWQGHSFVGQAGTTHRVTDAMVEEFAEEVVPAIPGFAWVTQDEISSVVTLPIAQTDVSGLTAALAAKYDKTGGTISGAVTVTGALVADSASFGATPAQSGRVRLTQGSSEGVSARNAGNSGDVVLLAINGSDEAELRAPTRFAANSFNHLRATGAGTGNPAVFEAIGSDSNVGLDILPQGTGTVRIRGALAATSTVVVTGAATVGGKITFGQTAVVVTGGTAFPGSPADNDQFYRTDLDMWFFYNGTRWLSTTLQRLLLPIYPQQSLGVISATTAAYVRTLAPDLQGGSDLWLEDFIVNFYVAAGGTALGASHSWAAALKSARDNTDFTLDTISTVTINSGSSAVVRRSTGTIDALMNNGTVHDILQIDMTKTGTPGTWQAFPELTYRVVAT